MFRRCCWWSLKDYGKQWSPEPLPDGVAGKMQTSASAEWAFNLFNSTVQICMLSIYLRAVQVIFQWIHSCVLPPACSPKQNGVFPAAPTLLKLTVSCCVIHLRNFWRCFRLNLPKMFGVHVWKQLSSVHLINRIFVWTDILTMKINYRQAEVRQRQYLQTTMRREGVSNRWKQKIKDICSPGCRRSLDSQKPRWASWGERGEASAWTDAI